MNSTWFRRYSTAAGRGPRLVCFPHAGGSATAYKPLAHALAGELDVLAVQYPGRQDRFGEEPFTELEPLVGAVAGELARTLAADPGRPYALFGHSMGALVAFETARRLEGAGLPGPQRLFVSGRGAPGTRSGAHYLHYDDADVLAEVRTLSGTDQALLDNPEVLEMVLPALRADYRVVAGYAWRGGEPLSVPVTALVGDRDPMVTVGEAWAWREHTTAGCALEVFPGGHFYLDAQLGPVASAVTEGLLAGTSAF
ncbi:thioesterase II family protein [Streptomyces sp. NPDC001594]|uniref:thioesterase II family protein n=1 Tax=Streptomyces sp. NPDC001594 TaxID=3364590 RepID=UPI0036924A31